MEPLLFHFTHPPMVLPVRCHPVSHTSLAALLLVRKDRTRGEKELNVHPCGTEGFFRLKHSFEDITTLTGEVMERREYSASSSHPNAKLWRLSTMQFKMKSFIWWLEANSIHTHTHTYTIVTHYSTCQLCWCGPLGSVTRYCNDGAESRHRFSWFIGTEQRRVSCHLGIFLLTDLTTWMMLCTQLFWLHLRKTGTKAFLKPHRCISTEKISVQSSESKRVRKHRMVNGLPKHEVESMTLRTLQRFL